MFDLTKKDTYYNVMKWHNEILDCTHEFVEISLVGNKLDLESEYKIYRSIKTPSFNKRST